MRNHTMTSPQRAKLLWKLCRQAIDRNVPGDFVECGVWKGGSAGIMATAAKNSTKKVHLYDSFEGLPEPLPIDGSEAIQYSYGASQGRLKTTGKCVGSLADVKNLMDCKLHISKSSIVYHVGWFQKTLTPWPTESISILRLDGDWYESTKICLENLYPALSRGGAVLMDDYFCWEGCRKACDEYREQHNITAKIVRIDLDSGYWIKA
ncbi:MAG: hypothetical protein EB023_12825 [Flavobacteriia bacterium]|nr:hypothetical protein [Flavobacteriia bacterium]